jgi:NuA3 HAT complex component NTO1
MRIAVANISRHDKERLFWQGLVDLKFRAHQGKYASVSDFSKDLALVFATALRTPARSFAEIMQYVSGRAEDMSSEQKELRARARYILRASQPLLEDAIRKESELTGRPFAQQIKELEEAFVSRRNSTVDSLADVVVESIEQQTNGVATPEPQDVDMPDADDVAASHAQVNGDTSAHDGGADTKVLMTAIKKDKLVNENNTPPASTNGINGIKHDPATILEQHGVEALESNGTNAHEPPTPPISLEFQGHNQEVSQYPAFGYGGIPWYVEQFDPHGTTIYEERWTGQQVLREMSEELSEMDEEELLELGPSDGIAVDEAKDEIVVADRDSKFAKPTKKTKTRKSGNGRGERSFRTRSWR